MRAAFVMVNHNGGDEVVSSVRSVVSELTDEDRLILVDNGSSDGSGPEAAALDERIEFIAHAENKPFAEATNIGIERARKLGYRYVGPINPDVRLRTGMLEALITRLQETDTSDLAAVSPFILYDDPGERIWFAGGTVLYPISWTLHKFNGKPRERAGNLPVKSGFVTGCCWLSPVSAWNETGLLDPSYGMYAEDVDWSLRARQMGKKLLVDPAAVLVHRVSASSGGGRTPFKMTYRTLAGRLLFHRHTPSCLRPLQAVLTPFFVAFYAVFLYLREGTHPANAYLRAWRTKRKDPVPWPPSRAMIENS